MPGSTACAGMGDEHRDDGPELAVAFLSGVVMGIALDRWLLPSREDVYSSARIGAAAALTIVLVLPRRGLADRRAGRVPPLDRLFAVVAYSMS